MTLPLVRRYFIVIIQDVTLLVWCVSIFEKIFEEMKRRIDLEDLQEEVVIELTLKRIFLVATCRSPYQNKEELKYF